MELVEGVSNEVLVALTATVLLGILTVYFASSNRPRSRAENERMLDTVNNIVGSQSSEASSSTNNSSSNVSDNCGESVKTGNSAYTNCLDEDNSTESRATSSFRNNPRRRVAVGNNLLNEEHEHLEGNHEETMIVKVKHNESIRSFNVSRNLTVIELKRLAFSNEMNAGKRIRFVFAGQLLRNDNDSLIRYGVLNNSVVHCVITDPPQQSEPLAEEQGEDLDLTRLLIPLLTVGLVMAWYGVLTYKHIFTGSSIAILMFLTSLYFILVYVTIVQP